MKLKIALTTLALALGYIGMAQKSSDVLITIEQEQITASEFMAIYNKNNVNIETADKKNVNEYLELFVNFKLKVHEAEYQGMDTAAKFTKEFNGYVDQLAKPYLVDKQFTEALIKEAYERSKWEIRAKHIMIQIPDNPTPQDTANAFAKANEVYAKAIADSVFSNVAVKYSDDPSVVKNGGDLGYFSAFRMVYPFETAAYNTPVGEIAKPIRTSFGYHIIKVVDKRPASGELKAAHIMIISNENTSPEDQKKAQDKINEIYGELEGGAEFSKLATTYSDDRGSAKKGGDLGWFGAGRMVPVFEEEAFALQANGDYTKPFKTQFGWHIVMREDKRNLGTYEEEYANLEKKVKQDQRSLGNQKSLVNKLLVDYKVKIKRSVALELGAVIDSTYIDKTWLLSNADGYSKSFMTINDKKYGKQKISYTQADFAQYLFDSMRRQKGKDLDMILNDQLDAFIEAKMIAYERSILIYKYPDYKALVTEYHDGILLFEIMEKEVWKKAVNDSDGIQAYYDAHIENYMWEDRMNVELYLCEGEDVANVVEQLVQDSVSDSTILAQVNKESQLALQVRKGVFEKSQEPVINEVPNNPGVYRMVSNDQPVVVKVLEYLPSSPKDLSEVRGLVISSYQDELDEIWIKALKEKYTYTINEEVLSSMTE